jgi:hypothetical protein
MFADITIRLWYLIVREKLKPLFPTHIKVKFCDFILLTETEDIVSNPHKC